VKHQRDWGSLLSVGRAQLGLRLSGSWALALWAERVVLVALRTSWCWEEVGRGGP
jgi:hypothetical protein